MAALTVERMRVVVLDCPVEVWDDPRVRDLFCRIVELKLKGYGAKYPPCVVPLEKVDFIGTHVLLCLEGPGGALTPISGFKYVTVERCREFLIPFKGFSVLEDARATAHLEVLHDWVERKNFRVGYVGSWTTHPDARIDEVASGVVHDWLALAHFHMMAETGVTGICATGILRMGVPKVVHWLVGYETLKKDGDVLPAFGQRDLNDEPALMLRLEDFSAEAIMRTKRSLSLWENRIVLSSPGRTAPNQLPEAA